MKCIEAIKTSKTNEVGSIKRINDVEAESMVRTGYWKYVPKSTYKSVIVPPTVNEQITDSVTQTKKTKKNFKK